MDARSRRTADRRRRPFPALLLLLAVALAACSTPAATASPSVAAVASPSPAPSVATPAPTGAPSPSASLVAAFPLTLTDDEGTEVKIPAEPQKIATLTNAATEIAFALGVGDRVVGKVEDFTPYPSAATSVPDVAKFGSVDVEKIVAMGTDLVIAGGSNFNPPEAIEKLRSLGVPVLVVFAPDVKTALADVSLIGSAVGRDEEAATLTSSIQAQFDQVAAATAGLAKPRVYYELDNSNGYFGPAPDYFGTEMIKIAGGEPLTTGTDGVYQLEEEQILTFDPEVILLGDASYGVTPEQVAARPGWGTLSAVKAGAVRPIDDVIVTRPGPRLGEGIRTLATAIHPELVLPSAAP